jgi:signal peptidase I
MKPRRPLLALFAALILPGLGQVYCGEVARGAVFLLSVAALIPAAAYLALRAPAVLLSPIVVLGACSALGIYVYSIIVAWRSAARLRDQFAPGPCNRLVVYFALLLFGHAFILTPSARYTKDRLVETFKVPSQSMLPTIWPGDRFFADKRAGHLGGPSLRRGAVAVFVYPNERTILFVKRIIGLPGDTVAIDGTSVKVNGRELRQEAARDLGDASLTRLLAEHEAFYESIDGIRYRVLWRKDQRSAPMSITVPNGHVFVLGDNRDASHDSRHFGVLPLADVAAVARQVWFSYDKGDGLRVRRTGQLLE